MSQSAFVRGFIDDEIRISDNSLALQSQSAFVRGFIDDDGGQVLATPNYKVSQSAFVRGFIDDF